MTQTVSPHSNNGGERQREFAARGRDAGKQPGNLGRVREAENEFVDNTVDADGAGDKGDCSVGRVAVDEVVSVEGS